MLIGCESDRIGGAPAPKHPDATVAAALDSGSGSGADALDLAHPDAAESAADAGFLDATPEDAGAPVDAAAPDAEPGDAGSAGPGQILVTDPVANRIYLLDQAGALLHDYPSPIAGVHGVAYDRRRHDGFWIAGRGATNPLFTKLDWSGAVVGHLDYAPDRLFQFVDEGVKSIDYALGAEARGDAIGFLFPNYNHVDVVGLAPTATVGWSGETSIGGLALGFQGVHIKRFSLSAAELLEFWSTKDGAIARWGWATSTPLEQHPIAGSPVMGGVDEAADGSFWVTDTAARTLIHLDAMGAQIGASVSTPGQSVADLSLVE